MDTRINFERLKEDLKAGKQMILFTGAGINLGSGVNISWKDALTYLFGCALSRMAVIEGLPSEQIKLIKEAVGADGNNQNDDKPIPKNQSMLESFATSEFPATIMVSIIKEYLGNSYISHLQDFFYSKCNRIEIYKDFEAHFKIKNGSKGSGNPKFYTLYQLARMIILCPNIKAVVTYNFDNFLKQAIEILYSKMEDYFYSDEVAQIKQNRSGLEVFDIYGDVYDRPLEEGKLYIYHMHGYIPSPAEADDVSGCKIVFSLDEFYEESRHIYSWQTTSQVHFLSHYTCIYAGISMADITSQRMLWYAKNSGNKERIYFLTAYPTPETFDQLHKDAYRTLANLKCAFFEYYGLTLLYGKDFVSLYETLGNCVDEFVKWKSEKDGNKNRDQK